MTKKIFNSVLSLCLVGVYVQTAQAEFIEAGFENETEVQQQTVHQPYVDFAEVERRAAQNNGVQLTPATRQTLTPESFDSWSQDKLDQFYALLTSGPIPGSEAVVKDWISFNGRIVVAGDGPIGRNQDLFSGMGLTRELVKNLGETLWKGKRMRAIDEVSAVLQNQIQIGTSRREWRAPAKVYCGVSKLDARRESIIIDYAYNDKIGTDSETGQPFVGGEFAVADHGGSALLASLPTRTFIDTVVNRKTLKIRDEVRMIRPGFYLGRAYADKLFVLNFTLYNSEIDRLPESVKADLWNSACWTGERQTGQALPVASH